MQSSFRNAIQESILLKQQLLADELLLSQMQAVVELSAQLLQSGGKLLMCGNGGSAADAQHLAAELSGRFYFDRPPLCVEALHVNTSYLTATANDYGYDHVFERAVQAQGRAGDMLWVFSTSGKSPNIINALQAAKAKNIVTVGFSGKTGGLMPALCDHLFLVPSTDTPRIQECHILLGHLLCEWIERACFGGGDINLHIT